MKNNENNDNNDLNDKENILLLEDSYEIKDRAIPFLRISLDEDDCLSSL